MDERTKASLLTFACLLPQSVSQDKSSDVELQSRAHFLWVIAVDVVGLILNGGFTFWKHPLKHFRSGYRHSQTVSYYGNKGASQRHYKTKIKAFIFQDKSQDVGIWSYELRHPGDDSVPPTGWTPL